jgi:hypothetical protein
MCLRPMEVILVQLAASESRRDGTTRSPARECRVAFYVDESRRDDTMPSSYVSDHVHIVFSTKNRLKVIPEDQRRYQQTH